MSLFSFNVTGLLRSAPGTTRRYPVSGERIPIAEDLELAAPIEGELLLARTGRSILVRGQLSTALEETCSRCLRPTAAPVEVSVEEEALPSVDLETGAPLDTSEEPEALRVDDHHELDLAVVVRDAISLAEPIAPLCRPDCRGLCPICGADLNTAGNHGHEDESIDPRLAVLAQWRESAGPR